MDCSTETAFLSPPRPHRATCTIHPQPLPCCATHPYFPCTHLCSASLPRLLLFQLLLLECCCLLVESPLCCFKSLQAPLLPPVLLLLLRCGRSSSSCGDRGAGGFLGDFQARGAGGSGVSVTGLLLLRCFWGQGLQGLGYCRAHERDTRWCVMGCVGAKRCV